MWLTLSLNVLGQKGETEWKAAVAIEKIIYGPVSYG